MTLPPLVHFRDPLPPHAERLVCQVQDLAYAFKLTRASSGSFKIARSDPNLATWHGFMGGGACVSIERQDGACPWVGFVRRVSESKAGPYLDYFVEDHAGYLFSRAVTTRSEPVTGAWGEIITQLYREADARAAPPLMAQLDVAGGPYGEYRPSNSTILSLLDSASKGSGWEWGLDYDVGSTVTTRLQFRERMGRDLSGEIVWEDGVEFADVTYTQDAGDNYEAAVAVGGAGDWLARQAVILNRAGAVGAGIQHARARTAARSTGLGGTAVYIDPQITGLDSLYSAAARAIDWPDQVNEQVSFSLVESMIALTLGDVVGTPTDLSTLHVGNYYTVRLSDLNFGHARTLIVRLLGFQMGADGIIECETQVIE